MFYRQGDGEDPGRPAILECIAAMDGEMIPDHLSKLLKMEKFEDLVHGYAEEEDGSFSTFLSCERTTCILCKNELPRPNTTTASLKEEYTRSGLTSEAKKKRVEADVPVKLLTPHPRRSVVNAFVGIRVCVRCPGAKDHVRAPEEEQIGAAESVRSDTEPGSGADDAADVWHFPHHAEIRQPHAENRRRFISFAFVYFDFDQPGKLLLRFISRSLATEWICSTNLTPLTRCAP